MISALYQAFYLYIYKYPWLNIMNSNKGSIHVYQLVRFLRINIELSLINIPTLHSASSTLGYAGVLILSVEILY
jgi:hypothetical protein